MNQCCMNGDNIHIIKEYDPQPKNKDGAIRWFLYRWDEGKKGVRRLVKCKGCGSYYLVQEYHLHKFSPYKDVVFADWYSVGSERQADYWNRTYTGIQLEHEKMPVWKIQTGEKRKEKVNYEFTYEK